ncbi:MAG: reverse transcriptase domain-containing protein, partial [Limnospira sp. PMC 1256.20]|nr:reverse transcriptase domain-containing protein [Limnospira sp. PMC 1256.20]
MEGRKPTKGNPNQQAMDRVQDRETVSDKLARVRQKAEADKTFVFVNLFHLLKVPLLREAFYALKRDASPGLDGMNWHMYERNLEERLPALQDELHRGAYRATPAKRTYIEKADGRKRPLGVQSVEDKVVQMACVMILTEVYEPAFKGSSYGSRPGRSPHMALDALHEGICRRKINWILDCDIEGFFDHLPHERLMEIIGERIGDPRLKHLILKWLKLGWVEEGIHHRATVGTPQGSVISPLLANIFLDRVMDSWMHQWRKTKAEGDVIGVRYVDDAVFGFQYENEARAFLEELREQLEANGLRLHPEKTRLIEFGRFAASNRADRGEGRPEPFDFLGFTHTCGRTRNGKFKIRRVTVAKRMTRKLAEIKEELRS